MDPDGSRQAKIDLDSFGLLQMVSDRCWTDPRQPQITLDGPRQIQMAPDKPQMGLGGTAPTPQK